MFAASWPNAETAMMSGTNRSIKTKFYYGLFSAQGSFDLRTELAHQIEETAEVDLGVSGPEALRAPLEILHPSG